MLLQARGTKAGAGIPTSSMADIAFLLLVFFLVTTVFDEEKGLALVLPTSEAEVSARNVVQFLVRPDGVVEVRRGESDQVQRIHPDEVQRVWQLEAAQNDKLVAAVQTDPEAPYRNMIRVLDGLQSGGAERISLQMLRK